MKFLSFDSYKKVIMDTTHPRTGKKVAFLIRDCHESKLPHLKPLEAMRGLRLFIVYRKSERSNGVVELNTLAEFSRAQSYAAHYSWPFNELQDHALMVNMGHADLSVLVDYRPNRAEIAKFLGSVNLANDGNYSGRPLKELTA